MIKGTIYAPKHMKKIEIDSRLFGSFVEHMGSVVYTGIFEPDHPTATPEGFRGDVLELVKSLNLGVVRYPGGNFTSGYNWKDTIGPVEDRPKKIELAWQGIEPNTFGLNEFVQWKNNLDAEMIMTINLGTKGLSDAISIVEYCNFPKGTYWSDLRREHGFEEPHSIKLWCLGNELDGEWQIGTKTPEDYGKIARQSSKVMKLVDDSIETILVGSSHPRLDTYPEWDRKVLMEAYEEVDYLAMHNYIDRNQDETLNVVDTREPDDIATYLGRSLDFDKQIDEMIAVCDYVKAVKRSNKTMNIAFDEWNVHKQPEEPYVKWQTGSPIDKCHFDLADALLFGAMGLSILRHAERVKISCQSLLVNTIPLILTEEGGDAWVNPTYYIMKDLATFGQGHLIQHNEEVSVYQTELFKNVPYQDIALVEDLDGVNIFVINKHNESTEINVDIQLEKELCFEKATHRVLTSESLEDKNTKDNVNRVVPFEKVVDFSDRKIVLKPYSWNVIRVPFI